jgi:hypothetical protein
MLQSGTGDPSFAVPLIKPLHTQGRLSCPHPYWNRLKIAGRGLAGGTPARPIIFVSAATGGATTRRHLARTRHGPAVRYVAGMRFPGRGVADDVKGPASDILADMRSRKTERKTAQFFDRLAPGRSRAGDSAPKVVVSFLNFFSRAFIAFIFGHLPCFRKIQGTNGFSKRFIVL